MALSDRAAAFVQALIGNLPNLIPNDRGAALSRADFDHAVRAVFNAHVPVPSLRAHLLDNFDRYASQLWATYDQ